MGEEQPGLDPSTHVTSFVENPPPATIPPVKLGHLPFPCEAVVVVHQRFDSCSSAD
jgi:hypothetical protein